jgi:hypothetical protein
MTKKEFRSQLETTMKRLHRTEFSTEERFKKSARKQILKVLETAVRAGLVDKKDCEVNFVNHGDVIDVVIGKKKKLWMKGGTK